MSNNSFEEKKLVIESLGLSLRSVESWNPEKDRNAWPELFEKIVKKGLVTRFISKVLLCHTILDKNSITSDDCYTLLITEPTVLWKCLLEVLTTESSNR